MIFLGPPGIGTHTPLHRPRSPSSPPQLLSSVRYCHPVDHPPLQSEAQGLLTDELDRLARSPSSSKKSNTPLRPRSRLPVLLAHLIPLRTPIPHRHIQQELLILGRDLRRRRSRRSHGRPPSQPRRSDRLQRSKLPTQRQTKGGHPLDRAFSNRPKPRNIQPALTASLRFP